MDEKWIGVLLSVTEISLFLTRSAMGLSGWRVFQMLANAMAHSRPSPRWKFHTSSGCAILDPS